VEEKREKKEGRKKREKKRFLFTTKFCPLPPSYTIEDKKRKREKKHTKNTTPAARVFFLFTT
jgi:hypothetical protein